MLSNKDFAIRVFTVTLSIALIPIQYKLGVLIIDTIEGSIKRNKDQADKIVFKSIDTGFAYLNNKLNQNEILGGK